MDTYALLWACLYLLLGLSVHTYATGYLKKVEEPHLQDVWLLFLILCLTLWPILLALDILAFLYFRAYVPLRDRIKK